MPLRLYLPSRKLQLSLPFNGHDAQELGSPESALVSDQVQAEMEGKKRTLSNAMQYLWGGELVIVDMIKRLLLTVNIWRHKDSQQKGHHRFAGKAGTRKSRLHRG
jgi:hypothetical protein